MIVIDKDLTFDADVIINKNGFKAKFGMRFALLGQKELDALLKRWIGQPPEAKKAADSQPETDSAAAADGSAPPITDFEFIQTVARGWSDVSGPQGPVEFSADALKRLCNLPGVNATAINAFLNGYEEAAEKNLPAQPGI